jgi:hypothetical protein
VLLSGVSAEGRCRDGIGRKTLLGMIRLWRPFSITWPFFS